MDESELLKLDYQREDAIEYIARRLEEMASYDFDRFISLMYRIDIEESRLRQLIDDSGDFYPQLAEWVILKLKQKTENRDRFTYRDLENDTDERW